MFRTTVCTCNVLSLGFRTERTRISSSSQDVLLVVVLPALDYVYVSVHYQNLKQWSHRALWSRRQSIKLSTALLVELLLLLVGTVMLHSQRGSMNTNGCDRAQQKQYSSKLRGDSCCKMTYIAHLPQLYPSQY